MVRPVENPFPTGNSCTFAKSSPYRVSVTGARIASAPFCETSMPIPPSSPSTPVPCIGIVGGVGSGKSALALWVAEHDSTLRVFDADAAGHRALTKPEVIRQLTGSFGTEILAPDGAIDRQRLAAIV